MSQEIADRLRRLGGYAAGLHRLMAEVRAQAPRSAAGADPSGTVHATIGPDGLPDEIRIEAGWKRGMHPESLAGAVVTAYTAAVAEGMRAWSETLTRTSWPARAAKLDGPTTTPDPDPLPSADHRPTRDPRSVTEEILAALRAVRSRPATPIVVTGSGGQGRVRLTLSPTGLHDCALDPGWASRQDGDALNAAIAEALAEARAELARQWTDRRVGTDPRQLADEALAALASLRAVAEQPTPAPDSRPSLSKGD